MERLIQQEQIVVSQKDFLEKIGLWATPELAEKYKYRLSPDALSMSLNEERDIEEIANLVYCNAGFLDGATKLYSMTLKPQFRSKQIGSLVIRALTSGVGRKEIPMQEIGNTLPFICRLDLMRTKPDNSEDALFRIAEIEGDKTHGFGYLTIIDLFRQKFLGRNDTIGIMATLKEELTRQQINPTSPVGLIVGLKERFYITELEIFARIAQTQGINLMTIQEDKLKITDEGIIATGICEPITNLVNIPSLRPDGYGQSGIDDQKLFDLYKSGKIRLLIPPKRFLGSKGLLALVSNGDENTELEEVLNQVFDPEALKGIRKFIPTTILVTKKNRGLVKKLLENQPDLWVIKQTMSSGMKGVALTDDIKKTKFIDDALNNPYNYVIQRKVEQETRAFRFSEPENISVIKSADMFMRIELFACRSGIATVAVTAREFPSVHGAKDCIQIPVIFKR